jgi:hypothetical protein
MKRTNEHKTYKGQFFSYDAIVAGVLFAVLLSILFVYWTSLRSLLFTQIDDMFRTSLELSNALLTPGYPADWTVSDVRQIGITTDFNSMRVDGAKLANLRNLSDTDYESMRSKLGLGPYQYRIVVGNVAIGPVPLADRQSRVTLVRPVVYENLPANLTITVWSNFTG